MTRQYAHPPVARVILSVDRRGEFKWPRKRIEELRDSLGAEWRSGKIVQIDDCWEIFHSLGDRLIQVSGGRFGFGWDGGTGFAYPAYETIRDGFLQWNAHFENWIGKTEQILAMMGWNVEYVNRIPHGTVWQNLDDLSVFRPLAAFNWPSHAGQLENADGGWTVISPDGLRLQVSWQLNSQETANALPEWTVTLASSHIGTADERDAALEIDELLAGLDAGRELIVTTFPQLFTRSANQYWDN